MKLHVTGGSNIFLLIIEIGPLKERGMSIIIACSPTIGF